MTASPAEDTLIQPTPMGGTWSPEHQIAQMLGLCEAQMDSAQQESDQAVDVLVQAFTTLVETTRSVGTKLAEVSAAQAAAGTPDPKLQDELAQLSRQMAAAVVAFQFYDKLTQRLGHVRYSLSALALFVCNPTQMQKPEQWDRLHSTLRRLYRTEAEREVFQVVMDGTEGTFASTPTSFAAKPAATGEVELF